MKLEFEHIIAEIKTALASTQELANQIIVITDGLEREIKELEIRLRKNGGKENAKLSSVD